MSLRPRDLSRQVKAGITALGLLCSVGLTWHATSAAFTGTTSNLSNALAAGTVAMADDDTGVSPITGTPMFSTAVSTGNLLPGNTGTRCIRVTYNGSLTSPTAVKVYATGLSGTGLGTYLDFSIEEDTNGLGDYSACGSFLGTYIHQSGTPAGSTGTLGYFAANMTNYSNGVGIWTPTVSGEAKTYRFRFTLQSNALADGLNATISLVWEAHSS